jgi:VirB8 protein.
MDEKIRNAINNYTQQPPKHAWNNINSQIAQTKTNWWKVFTISGVCVLVGVVAIVILAPQKEVSNSKSLVTTSKNVIFQTPKTQSAVQNINTGSVISQKEQTINSKAERQYKLITSFSVPQLQNSIIANPINNSNAYNTLNSLPAKENVIVIPQKSIQVENADNIIALNQDIKTKSNPVSNEDTVSSRRELFVPNAFTPIKSTNNVFKPKKTQLLSYELSIYNRGGVMIFHTTNIDEGWNGYYKGNLCAMGSYVYVIKFENYSHYSSTQKGMLNLIR